MSHAQHPSGGNHFANFEWHGVTYELWINSNGWMFAEVGVKRVEDLSLHGLQEKIKKAVASRRLRIKVDVHELRGGEFMHGVITSVNPSGDYLVKWDDGETDKLRSYSSAYDATRLTDVELTELKFVSDLANAANKRRNEILKKAAMDLGKPVKLALDEARARQAERDAKAAAE